MCCFSCVCPSRATLQSSCHALCPGMMASYGRHNLVLLAGWWLMGELPAGKWRWDRDRGQGISSLPPPSFGTSCHIPPWSIPGNDCVVLALTNEGWLSLALESFVCLPPEQLASRWFWLFRCLTLCPKLPETHVRLFESSLEVSPLNLGWGSSPSMPPFSPPQANRRKLGCQGLVPSFLYRKPPSKTFSLKYNTKTVYVY